jgi:hypothetical protein
MKIHFFGPNFLPLFPCGSILHRLHKTMTSIFGKTINVVHGFLETRVAQLTPLLNLAPLFYTLVHTSVD